MHGYWKIIDDSVNHLILDKKMSETYKSYGFAHFLWLKTGYYVSFLQSTLFLLAA